MSIPKINKKVTDFFTSEEGSISKDKLIKTGIIIGTFAISSSIASSHSNVWNDCNPSTGVPSVSNGPNAGSVVHSNSINLTKTGYADAKGEHCNGQSHNSHSSHSSHGSHGSCGRGTW